MISFVTHLSLSLSAPLSFSALSHTMICELGMSQRQNQSSKAL